MAHKYADHRQERKTCLQKSAEIIRLMLYLPFMRPGDAVAQVKKSIDLKLVLEEQLL